MICIVGIGGLMLNVERLSVLVGSLEGGEPLSVRAAFGEMA